MVGGQAKKERELLLSSESPPGRNELAPEFMLLLFQCQGTGQRLLVIILLHWHRLGSVPYSAARLDAFGSIPRGIVLSGCQDRPRRVRYWGLPKKTCLNGSGGWANWFLLIWYHNVQHGSAQSFGDTRFEFQHARDLEDLAETTIFKLFCVWPGCKPNRLQVQMTWIEGVYYIND